MKIARLIAAATLLFATVTASAFDFKSIGNMPTTMYDTPSLYGIKRFVAPPGMPVEVVHAAHGWSKVRDFYGDMVWVESKALSDIRTVVVTTNRAIVRQNPTTDASTIFTAAKGVVLTIDGPIDSQWIKVSHQNGLKGYILTTEVWGI